MLRRPQSILCLFAAATLFCAAASASQSDGETRNGCITCHATKQSGFVAGHAFAADNCVSCHAGNNTADTEEAAHAELISFPGDLGNAERTCGNCHAERVASVTDNLMHTGHGMVDVTRRIIENKKAPDHDANLQSLGHGVADSMLRKLCASCHTGQSKKVHQLDVMRDRGGGCLACHINSYPPDAHPSLTTQVSDARCFGCHSRSGRISLSYAGLAEVDETTPAGPDTELKLRSRLPDGRRVQRKPADVHYLAGMGCIDCHTSVGLMGDAANARHQSQAVDIACVDCHENDSRRIGLDEWPALMSLFKRRLPFLVDTTTRFLATAKNSTPLWHIELRPDGAWLHTKNTARVLKIPELNPAYHSEDADHVRLKCVTCHSQWAPQCFGCHMEYQADGVQWDHVEQIETAGRWHEERSQFRNELVTLGVDGNNRIAVFVPGMIMTVAHPDWEDEKFIREFAPLSPHTTGAARSCDSCHRSSEAMGLGQGDLYEHGGGYRFTPSQEKLQDGLPGDAWTDLEGPSRIQTGAKGQRPLNKDEIEAMLGAPLD
jgi:hypothetical protein